MKTLVKWVGLIIFFGLIAILVKELVSLLSIEGKTLPRDTLFSFFRMSIAYFFSLAFAIVCGFTAASRKWAEKLLLPTIDILQSVPVVGFFPVALLFFISLFQGERIRIELASIFLIFTSQAWNMAFGIYESLITIPKDIQRAAAAYNINKWLKFKRILFPACIPKLIYNSMVSWATGWYFLMACEIIAIGAKRYYLPGIGSFLFYSSDKGRYDLTLLAFSILVFIIVLMDIFLWHPLSVWANKFTYQMIPQGETTPKSFWLSSLKDLLFSLKVNILWIKTLKLLEKKSKPFRKAFSNLKESKIVITVSNVALYGLYISLIFLGIYLVWWSLESLIKLLSHPIPREAKLIPFSILVSFLRLLIAYLICLAWTVPLIQILAAIPATALFPFIVVLVNRYLIGGMNLASFLIVFTGMQWYVLFNLIVGVRTIPEELKESVLAFGASKWFYIRKVILPASFLSLITGSLSGWGGAWNALVVSEYVVFNDKVHSVFGIGPFLDIATYEKGNSLMIFLCLASLILTIILLNKLVWQKLYNLGANRFSLEVLA